MRIEIFKIENETKLSAVIDHAVQLKCSGLAESTIIGHIKKSNQIKGWIGQYAVGQFRENEWLQFEAELFAKGYARRTIKNFMEIINPTIKLLTNSGYLKSNPLGNKGFPVANNKPPEVFTVNDIRRLITIDKSFRTEILLIQFALLTGLRIGELLALNEEGFNRENGQYLVEFTLAMGGYKVTKTTSSRRLIDLSENAISILEQLILLAKQRRTSIVNVTQRDNITVQSYTRTMLAFNSKRNEIFNHVDDFKADFFKAHCQSRGIKYIAPKNLRHTFASQLLTKGIPLAWVAKQMGHTTKEMIEKHYGVWIKEDATETYDKVEEHFSKYFELPSVKAANDDVFETQPISFWKRLLLTFCKKAS
ncbi:tyrosine-type recombinase/integrase [Pseudoalteromonas sp. SD03]|uniref:Tyrosine-type recombinase/integrase n=1 Tax=Pseudoalteromonas sp. SD03 TaxID=3231719 RepID=A0AB39ATS3_9GAMM|nr:tyrosine-type recombinase/integrase [Pseudoalteromonas undina]